MRSNGVLLFILLTSLAVVRSATAADLPPGVLADEFIYTEAPTPQCHASTIEATKDGLVAAWFGGTRESASDVGIWFARHTKDGWTKPVEVANGKQPAGKQWPCWNPVLFQMPAPKINNETLPGEL